MRSSFWPVLGIVLGAWLAAVPGRAADDRCGTFSIVACDTTTGEVGVAVQSRVFGVGPRVAWVRGGIGAIATQAQSNESFGPRGLDLLAAGLSAGETLEWLVAHDTLAARRQLGVVDARGSVAHWTGPECLFWAGDSSGGGFTCQGNILVGPDVVAAMVGAFEGAAGRELADRLIAALEAGQAAGGDSRGRQSAAVLVGRPHPEFPEYAHRYVDIRVDDHATPIAELRRLYDMYAAQGLVQAHSRFADYLARIGDEPGAQRERTRIADVLRRLLAQNVEEAGTLNALAWYAATHDLYLSDALIAAQRAVALEPENSNILDTLAEVHFRRGEIGQAIAVAERALTLSPDDPYLQGQLARFRGAR